MASDLLLQDKVQAEFKLPILNIFHTPDGIREFKAIGSLNLNQKDSYALGAIRRQIGFESYHLAENLLTSTFFEVFNKIKDQDTTLQFEVESEYVQSPMMSGNAADSNVHVSLEMNVPQQQKLRIQLPILEQIKLAWIQYVSFLLIFVTLMRLTYKLL